MSLSDADRSYRLRPRLRPAFRLHWEAASSAYLLVYPEGSVQLNPSAGEILLRCDGTRELDDIIGELEELFSASDLAADVYRFIEDARQRQWLE